MKIGVFLCKCGPNIADRVDLDRVAQTIGGAPDVALVMQENFPCSPAGKAAVRQAIADHGLTHCVFAACSHREHEKTFAGVLADAGLNPYLLEMANVREHCAWIVDDQAQATARALGQIRSALAKVRHNQALAPKEIEVNPAIAVIGGGIAGIKAAKLAARGGRQVYLIERAASVGGKMPQWEKSYPTMDCNPCFLAPEISSLSEIKNIEILTLATIEDVVGFFGSFRVKVRQAARHVTEACMACGECGKACPVQYPNPFDYGLSQRGAIHVAFPGCLPAAAAIDHAHCVRDTTGEACTKCSEACMFGAINYALPDTVRELEVGALVLATGFTVPELADQPALGTALGNVITSAQLERLLSSTGPTKSHLQLADGRVPQSVTIVTCAGRGRYCSRVCCAVALKYAKYLADHYPELALNLVHHDLCLTGDGYQKFYEEIVAAGRTKFHRMRDWRELRVEADGARRTVRFRDLQGGEQAVSADLVVLSVGMQPTADNGRLWEMLGVETDRQGFIAKNHSKMDPNMSNLEGVYIAGCAGGPRDEPETVTSAEGGTGQAISRLIPGAKIRLEVITSYVDEDLCSGCHACLGVCAYKAIGYNAEKKTAEVSEILCKGCGTCVAACPSSAMKNHHFEAPALRDALVALLAD